QRYLEKLAEMISRYLTLPGRAVQPLADASFDTWIKFYRPDANTPNATISYYQKGALVALLLDLRIRQATGNARSMDDLMRLLWERYGVPDTGFPEGAVEDAAAEVAGTELRGFFDHALRSTAELDFAGALAVAGLQMVPVHEAALRPPPAGGPVPGGGPMPGAGPAPGAGQMRVPNESRTGLTLRGEGGRVVVVNVLAGSAAWRAGVNAGDELVALDGFRIPAPEWLNARLMEHAPGAHAVLTVFRRDELLTLPLPVEQGPPPRWMIRPAPDATPAQQALLADWLRTVVPDGPAQESAGSPPAGWAPPAVVAEPGA
ncbi:MAG TPA: PDZ domain-containing protein, partial [Longimicrobium sp.]|nr:PDZ domain-containing protein [Longimicrobium sp.]